MDEDSMASRSFWAWFQHRAQEGRVPECVLSDDGKEKLYTETTKLSPHIYMRPWGGIPIIYSMGDCFQLASIGRSTIDMETVGNLNSSDMLGKMIFADFLDPPDKEEAVGVTVMMNEVLRQNDITFLSFLHNLRYGKCDEVNVDFLLSRCLDKFSVAERTKIEKNAIHLCPTWKMTQQITFDYLQSFDNPVAVMMPKLESIKSNNQNCCIKEMSYPMLTAFTVGAKVMLLKNFIVELNLMNGAVGTVKDIVYKEEEGPNNINNIPAYIIVDFPKCLITDENKFTWKEQDARTNIPIPVITERCEKMLFHYYNTIACV